MSLPAFSEEYHLLYLEKSDITYDVLVYA